MKVKELIDKLSKFDQEADILGYTEDEGICSERNKFLLLDINDINQVEANKRRTIDEIPTLEFNKGSKKHVLIDMIF